MQRGSFDDVACFGLIAKRIESHSYLERTFMKALRTKAVHQSLEAGIERDKNRSIHTASEHI